MPRGGARPGAGRPKGTENPETRKRRKIAAEALDKGITPLEVMLETMRELYDAGKKLEACGIAKDAAPYTHARLQQIEAKVESEVTQRTVSGEPLEPDAWEQQYGNGQRPAH